MTTEQHRHGRFHIRSLEQLRAEIQRMGLSLPVGDDVAALGRPLAVAGRTAPNRFCAQPMEGFDAVDNGAPGPLTFRRYLRYARGGFGMIWVEATSVLPESRSNPRQLFLHKDNVHVYRQLVASVRHAAQDRFGQDVVMVVQLTHSGRYSKPTGLPKPIIAHHSPILDPQHKLPADYPLVTDEYLDRLQDVYVAAARLARDAGFDGVDIKSCHRYLVAELHASFTREGRYGGSFENRTRLLREALARIRADVPEVFVTTRMNAFDAIPYPYGFGVNREDGRLPDLDEPLRLAAALKDLGAPLLNISIGNPYFNPHYGRPFDFPVWGGSPPDEHPLVGLDRFMKITRRFQEAFGDLPIVGSGYSWLRQFMPHVASEAIKSGGAALCGIGRGAFAYPDTPKDVIETGRMDPAKCCVTCSACTQIMRDGAMTGCVVRDPEIYGPQYRLGRRFALDRLRAEAECCRDCEQATCTRGCPARVDVPAFVRAFAAGDIRLAYDTLRKSNALPEMCACVCPSDVQCEGQCLENIFCERPVPIRDIQRVTCQIARREGMTGARIPERVSAGTVAVAGAGPAGLAAAIQLLEAGHRVDLLERGQAIGGTPDRIIPDDRYDSAREEVEAILEPARRAGRLEVKLGQQLGKDFTLKDLRERYDAVLLAVGLDRSVSLGSADGVVDAPGFLAKAKQGDIKDMPPRVAVLGGGNTAMDAAMTARRLGARDVFLVYRRSFTEMPAWPKERDAFLAAGGHCLILTQPLGYETDETGRLTGLKIARSELGEPDAAGRRQPRVVPGSESVLPVNLVVEALGQGVGEDVRRALEGLRFNSHGLVETVAGTQATSVEGVFAAGDLVNGGTTAVQGIAEGMKAADEIRQWLAARP